MKRKKPLPLLENILITDVAAEGKALARVEGKALFVPFAVPGDVVNVQVCRKRKQYMEGYVVQTITPSPMRIAPFCAHSGVCGGCKWQALAYPEQLALKQRQVQDQLQRIGHFAGIEVRPIVAAPATQHYRNKLEFTFSNKRWRNREELGDSETDLRALGFHIPAMFDKVLDVEQCYLQAEPSNSIRASVKRFATAHDYAFFDLRQQQGLLRNLIVRTASSGEVMVIVVFFENDQAKITPLMQHLQKEFPQITSLLYVVNHKANDTIHDQEVVCFAGRPFIYEEMEGLRFKIGAKSFYQTNSEQAHQLYSIARDFAQLTGEEVVYDLYTGAGTIACFVAGNAKRVVGVEYVESAIEDARENARLNNIGNARFYAGDMKDVLTPEFVATNGAPDVVILDPPRAGIHGKVVQMLLQMAAPRMVYVSCNPATQARDLALLSERYCIDGVQPVDMFPHTHHVENVVRLRRKEG